MERIKKHFEKIDTDRWKPIPNRSTDVRTAYAIMETIGKHLCRDFIIDEVNKDPYTRISRFFMGLSGSPDSLDPYKGIYLHGIVGSGKTMLMSVMKKICDIYARVNNFRYLSALSIFNEFELGGSESLLDYYRGSLLIDDLGNEPPIANYYGTAVPVLPLLIAKRYDRWISSGERTHFTSNFDMYWIEDNYGYRERSRIEEMCNIVKLESCFDRRIKTQKDEER